MVELSQQMLDVAEPAQCIQLFQLQKLTLKKGEDMFQKLSTVYYSSMGAGLQSGGDDRCAGGECRREYLSGCP